MVQSVDRALEILCQFSPHERELGITELSQRLGLSKSATHALVKSLEKKGFLTQNPENSRYRELNNKGRLTAEEEAEREDLRAILFERIMSMPFEELFDYRDIDFKIPPRARIHQTVRCAGCGEGVMETRSLMTDKGLLCPECQVKEA